MENRGLIPSNRTLKMNSNTILYNYWKPACFFAWFVFILFEVLIEYDYRYSKSPLCPYTDENYNKAYFYINYSVFGGFVTSTVFTFLTILWVHLDLQKKLSLIVSLNIVLIGSITTLLSFYNWGGLCIDVLGTPSPAAIWGEWLSCAPLLIFVVISITNKYKLSRTDYFLMFSFFLCILFGFFIILSQKNKSVAEFWFSMSVILYLPILYLPWNSRVLSIEPSYLDDNASEIDLVKYQANHTFAIYQNLAYCLNIVLPLYTVNYIITMSNGIDYATSINIYQILTLLTKGLFIIIIMNRHIELYELAIKTINYYVDKNRREFIKYIFHEVRTPLNSLSIGIDLLNDNLKSASTTTPNQSNKCTNTEEKNILVMMRASAEFMGDTLNNILSIQKMEEGLLTLEFEPMTFEKCIRNVLLSVSGSLIQKSMIVNTNISLDIPKIVYGDRYAIEHVIINLLSNAIKFSEENKVIKIDIFCSTKIYYDSIIKNNRVNITINISDQGVGISPENQEKLFGNFVQFEPRKTQKGQGSGLGLSYCKKVIELHGGTISVISIENIGSIFTVTIPFVIVSDPNIIASFTDTNDVDKKLNSETHDNICCCADLRVLLVDDSVINNSMLAMLLRKLGFSLIDTAENGKIAVEKTLKSIERAAPYDIIFIDNLMPEMNGTDAVRIMRSNGFNRLIIGITGNIMDNDEVIFLNSGVDMICEKPIKYEKIKRISRFVKQNGCLSRSGGAVGEKLIENTMRGLSWKTK